MSQNTSGKNQKTDSLMAKGGQRYSRAHKIVCENLRKDPDLYYAYQANIAMAFQDEVANYRMQSPSKYLNRMEIHMIANNAATNFLNQLIKR